MYALSEVEAMTDALRKNIDTLNSFKALEANWDYDNAEPFDPAFVDSIITMLPSLSKQPKIFLHFMSLLSLVA